MRLCSKPRWFREEGYPRSSEGELVRILILRCIKPPKTGLQCESINGCGKLCVIGRAIAVLGQLFQSRYRVRIVQFGSPSSAIAPLYGSCSNERESRYRSYSYILLNPRPETRDLPVKNLCMIGSVTSARPLNSANKNENYRYARC